MVGDLSSQSRGFSSPTATHRLCECNSRASVTCDVRKYVCVHDDSDGVACQSQASAWRAYDTLRHATRARARQTRTDGSVLAVARKRLASVDGVFTDLVYEL